MTVAIATNKWRLRHLTEPVVFALLLAASGIAVLTTVGIVLSVAAESWRFFQQVPLCSFLFGTEWSPSAPVPSFGFVPLIVGTLLITIIAVIVATPLGLLSAIYLAEYATPTARATAKPSALQQSAINNRARDQSHLHAREDRISTAC